MFSFYWKKLKSSQKNVTRQEFALVTTKIINWSITAPIKHWKIKTIYHCEWCLKQHQIMYVFLSKLKIYQIHTKHSLYLDKQMVFFFLNSLNSIAYNLYESSSHCVTEWWNGRAVWWNCRAQDKHSHTNIFPTSTNGFESKLLENEFASFIRRKKMILPFFEVINFCEIIENLIRNIAN